MRLQGSVYFLPSLQSNVWFWPSLQGSLWCRARHSRAVCASGRHSGQCVVQDTRFQGSVWFWPSLQGKVGFWPSLQGSVWYWPSLQGSVWCRARYSSTVCGANSDCPCVFFGGTEGAASGAVFVLRPVGNVTQTLSTALYAAMHPPMSNKAPWPRCEPSTFSPSTPLNTYLQD